MKSWEYIFIFLLQESIVRFLILKIRFCFSSHHAVIELLEGFISSIYTFILWSIYFKLCISNYLYTRFLLRCAYSWPWTQRTRTRVAPVLRWYSYSFERWAPILMSISGFGPATVLRGDSRKHNEVSRDRPTWLVPRRLRRGDPVLHPRLISRMHRHL